MCICWCVLLVALSNDGAVVHVDVEPCYLKINVWCMNKKKLLEQSIWRAFGL